MSKQESRPDQKWLDKAFRAGFEAGGKWGLKTGFEDGFKEGARAGIQAGMESSLEKRQAAATSTNALRSEWHESAITWAIVRGTSEPKPTAKQLRGEILDMINNHPDRKMRAPISDAGIKKLLERNKERISGAITRLRKTGYIWPSK